MTVPISRFEMPVGALSGGEAVRKRSVHVTTNPAGIREYVPGDSFNRIHWRSSARYDELMVKEYEMDPLVDVWLFVDFSAVSLVEDPSVQRIGRTGPVIPMGAELPPSTEEYGVVIAASLATHFIETQQRSLGFAAYVPHREIYEAEKGSRQLLRILQTLAVARSFAPYTLAQMLSLETPYVTRGTTLVIITSSLDTSWVVQTQILSRKGIRPMCVLVDPQSFGGYQSPDEIRGLLRLARVPTMVVRRGDDLTTALAQRPL